MLIRTRVPGLYFRVRKDGDARENFGGASTIELPLIVSFDFVPHPDTVRPVTGIWPGQYPLPEHRPRRLSITKTSLDHERA
jgi:hypothetical protein